MPRFPLLIACVALLVASCAGPDRADQGSKRPNIVVLFTDDMGYGDIESYGAPEIRTPNIDRIGREGIRFTSFYSAPWCVPSRVQLLTGRYLGRVDLGGGTGANGNGGLPASEVTIAEQLQEAGYYTQMLGKWHLGHAEDRFLPHNNGFDDWWGLPYSNDYMRPWVQTDVPLNLYHNSEVVEHPVNQNTLTTRYTERAVELIKSGGEQRPFFLYLAYNMPHLPVHTAERFRGQSTAELYGDVIETLDWSVGQVMQALEEEGIADNTIVVFASDNGPWINMPPRMQQAGNKLWHAGSTGPLRGAKATTYEGGQRVPGIIHWPQGIEGGRTSSEPFSLLDLFPTLLRAAGAEVPDDRAIDGQNLLPYLRGETDQTRERLFYAIRGDVQAVRSGPWKLRVTGEGENVQLFHLRRDVAERLNEAEDHPELVDSLRTILDSFEQELNR